MKQSCVEFCWHNKILSIENYMDYSTIVRYDNAIQYNPPT